MKINSGLTFCTLLVLSLSVLADTAPSETDRSDLEAIEQNKYGEFLAAGVDWSSYSGIKLEKATVTFRKDWVHDQRQRYDNIIREKDEERIKTGMLELLDDVLRQKLPDKSRYLISDESGAGVMRFTPRIMDLDIVAPDRVSNRIGETLADSKLSMTLQLEIHDAVSGELLAKSWKYLDDPYSGYMEKADSPSNRRAARLMIERWTTWLLELLDVVRQEAPE